MREIDMDKLSNGFQPAKNRSHPTMREEFLYKSFDSPLKSTTAYDNVQTHNLKSSADIYLLEDKMPVELTPIRQSRHQDHY